MKVQKQRKLIDLLKKKKKDPGMRTRTYIYIYLKVFKFENIHKYSLDG